MAEVRKRDSVLTKTFPETAFVNAGTVWQIKSLGMTKMSVDNQEKEM